MLFDLILELLSLLFSTHFIGFGFPALLAGDSFSVGAKNQTLFVERVPRQDQIYAEDSERQR